MRVHSAHIEDREIKVPHVESLDVVTNSRGSLEVDLASEVVDDRCFP